MKEQPRVILETCGQTAWITLNRPDKLNVIDPRMLSELEQAIVELEASPNVHVAIIKGAGERAFCAGADINAWASLGGLGMWRTWIKEGWRVFRRLAQLRQPTISAINGYCFGGGLELALATDLRIASHSAVMSAPEVSIGTVPGWGATQYLPQLIGPARAKEMILCGANVEAETAERWGLVNHVVDGADLCMHAQELADKILENAPIAVQIAKQIINGGLGQAQGATLEALASGLSAMTADLDEGVAAFRARRPASFEGH